MTMMYTIDYSVQDLSRPEQTRTVHFATMDLPTAEDAWAQLGRAIVSLMQIGSTDHRPSQILEVIVTANRSLLSD